MFLVDKIAITTLALTPNSKKMNTKAISWFVFSVALFFTCVGFIIYTYMIEY